MKVWFALPLLLAAWTPALAAPPAKPETFGEAVEVNVVNVEVYATDKAGNRVTDLRKGDFELFEDGKRVEISNFEAVSGAAGAGSGGQKVEPLPGGAPSSAPAPAAAVPAAASPEDAWNLVVYFDNMNIRPASRTRAIQQLREFLTRQLAPGDRVMLVTNDLGFHIRLPFSSDPAAIAQALDGLGKLTAEGDTIARDRLQAFHNIITIQTESLSDPTDPVPCPHSIASPAHAFASARRQDVLRTIGSLTLLVNSLSGVPGRKALLHVSDGIPLIPGDELFQFLAEICGGSRASSGLGKTGFVGAQANNGEDGSPSLGYDASPGERALQVYDATTLGPKSYQAASQAPMDAQNYNVAKNLQTLAAHANAHRVTLYTLQPGLQAPGASAADVGPEERLFQFPSIGTALRANNRDSLQLLAAETGGRSILDANNFLPDLARVREDALSFYSLGFSPAHSGDGREHQIEVKVKRPGLQLRYRQSYRDKTALEKIVDRTFSALLYNAEDNPLDISIEIGEQTPGTSGLVSVPVRLRIPLFKLAILNRDDTFQGNLKLFVITRSPNGATSQLRQVAVPLSIPRKDVLRAMGQFYLYTLTLQLQPGEQQVALAVRDDIAATTSYLSRAITVAPVNTTAVNP